MVNLMRTSKSGNDWTPNDLLVYNIRIEHQDFRAFFGVTDLPQPCVESEVLTASDADATHHDDPYALLRTMELAMNPIPDEESAVGDFTVQLLRAVKYTGRAEGRVSRTRKSLSFWASGQQNKLRRTSASSTTLAFSF